jgi:hypothetical protein
MFTAELLGMLIAWLLAAILLSLFLLLLVVIWGQIIHTMKVWFGLPGMSREPPGYPLSHPHEHSQVPEYPPVSQNGYERRDYR